MTCDFWGKTSTGGITRAKNHQMGMKGNVNVCRKTPKDGTIKGSLWMIYKKKKDNRRAKERWKRLTLGVGARRSRWGSEAQEISRLQTGKGL